MNKLLSPSLRWASTIASLMGALFFFTSCKEDPQSANGPVQTFSPNGSAANPALTYAAGVYQNNNLVGSAIFVADSDANHQTKITQTFSNGVGAPSWSPTGSSICFHQAAPSGPDTIRAIDVSVNSHGTPVGSNYRTIYGFPSTSVFISPGASVSWSSTTSMGQIAYCTSNGSGITGLWVISQSGGTPTNIFSVNTATWTFQTALNYPTWCPDDSKLAVVRADSFNIHGAASTIMIFNTSTWTYVDSVKVPGKVTAIEWSRTGSNKLAFGLVMHGGANVDTLNYCDATFGSTRSNNGIILSGGVTWSPNNSSLLYTGTTTGGAFACRKLTAFSGSNSVLTTAFRDVKWKR